MYMKSEQKANERVTAVIHGRIHEYLNQSCGGEARVERNGMIHNSETEKLFKAKESTKKRMQLKEKKKIYTWF